MVVRVHPNPLIQTIINHMDSKVDKQIRRYLKRISTKASQADAYNSYHYDINYGWINCTCTLFRPSKT